MTKKWVWMALFGLLAWVHAAGVRVTLYASFAEVQTPVRLDHGVYVWQPGERALGSLVEDLVWLSGVEVKRRVWRKGALWFFAQGDQARLHYLTQGLSGSVRYRFLLDQGRLEGWLRVRNTLDEPVEVEALRFLSGNVPLSARAVGRVGDKQVRALAVAKSAPVEEGFVGAQGGVFRYQLAGPLRLEPEVTELPLFEAQADPVFFWRYRGGFVRGRRLPLERGYRFQATAPLAAGVVDLFQAGDFLGRLSIPDRYPGEPVELRLGPATRARTERQVEALAETRELRRYRVTTRVRNPGEEPVRVEIEERFSADAIEITLSGGERIPQGYRIVFDLPPGGERTYQYTVTLRYKKRP